jgi:hypothetical protein
MPKRNELNIEKRLIDLLKQKNIFNVKGNSYNMKGFPDRLVFADKIYFVELKLGKEEGSYYGQQPMQKWWQNKITEANGNYILLKGLREVEFWVESLPNLKKKRKSF